MQERKMRGALQLGIARRVQARQPVWNEARPRRVDMPVALRALAMGEEALRHHEMQIVFGSRHRDIEQPALLLDLGRGAGGKVGRDAAVHDVEHEDRFPFLSLGRMDRRQDQIILVEQRHARLVAGRVGRIEGDLGQETLARWIAVCNLLQLYQIGASHDGILVNAIEMRFVPKAFPLQFGRPSRAARIQVSDGLHESPPAISSMRRRGCIARARGSDQPRPSCGRARAAP